MTTFEITELRPFMNQLLSGDTFDIFLLEEASLCTALTYTIDGHIHPEFYPLDERGEDILPYKLQPWSDIRRLCFDLIKGKHTPLSFKFVLQLKPELTASLLAQKHCSTAPSLISALVLTIRYDGSHAHLVTGVSYSTFVMDKEPDDIWDQALSKYLSDKNISFTSSFSV